MTKQLDKVIIITGASAGIGAAMVRVFAEAGASVMLSARRTERLQALIAEVAHHPGERAFLAGDVRDVAYCEQLMAETMAAFGRIDVLINNAGLGHQRLLSEIPLADVSTVLDTNVLGPIHMIQAALPYMRQQNSGHIINISSIVGQRPLLKSSVYCASKSALNFLTRSLRMELRRDNITVSLLYPGLTATEFDKALLGGQATKRPIPGIAPERVAKAALRGIRKRRQEIYVTWFDLWFTHINRLFPRLTDMVFGLLGRF